MCWPLSNARKSRRNAIYKDTVIYGGSMLYLILSTVVWCILLSHTWRGLFRWWNGINKCWLWSGCNGEGFAWPQCMPEGRTTVYRACRRGFVLAMLKGGSDKLVTRVLICFNLMSRSMASISSSSRTRLVVLYRKCLFCTLFFISTLLVSLS